jgi:hypothetical protein
MNRVPSVCRALPRPVSARARLRLMLAVSCALLSFVGCAAPKPAPRLPPPVLSCPPPAAPVPYTSEAPRVPQGSLLEHVPESATFAFVVRRNSLAWLERTLLADPKLQEELRVHFEGTLGVNFTAAQGLVLLGFADGERLDAALFVHVPSLATLKGPARGLHRDIPLVGTDEKGEWVGASLREGVWIGHERAVKLALDHELDKGPTLFLDVDGADVDMLGFLRTSNMGEGQVSALSRTFGIEHAVLKLDASRKMTLILKGKDGRVEQAKAAFDAGLSLAVAALSESASGEPQDPWTRAFSIFAYHEVRKFADAVSPRVEGISLVSEYSFGQWLDSAPLGAAAAALTVPVVLSYVTQSRTAQAVKELHRVAAALATYHQSTKPAALKKGKGPLSSRLRIARTPRTIPCGSEARWDEGEIVTWQELGYAPADAMRYALEVGPPKTLGRTDRPEAVLLVRAQGDLDCDGVLSRFDLFLHYDAEGNLVPLGDVEAQNESE